MASNGEITDLEGVVREAMDEWQVPAFLSLLLSVVAGT